MYLVGKIRGDLWTNTNLSTFWIKRYKIKVNERTLGGNKLLKKYWIWY